jgi:hypothetical protein
MGYSKVNMCAATLFRILHIVWAIVSLTVCVVLATSKGGHPPAIILLPLRLYFGCLGICFCGLFLKLLGRAGQGRAGQEAKNRYRN